MFLSGSFCLLYRLRNIDIVQGGPIDSLQQSNKLNTQPDFFVFFLAGTQMLSLACFYFFRYYMMTAVAARSVNFSIGCYISYARGNEQLKEN